MFSSAFLHGIHKIYFVILLMTVIGPVSLLETQVNAAEKEILDIGSRRELFIDEFLIGELKGKATQRLHHPVPQEIVIKHEEDWEGTASGFHSIFKDGDIYRMYYNALHFDFSTGLLDQTRHENYCCYAESQDGIHWTKPNLGIHDYKGSKKNNIVMVSAMFKNLKADPGHPSIFKDETQTVRQNLNTKR